MTEARLEANRRSAKKSIGPRSEAGKARSRMKPTWARPNVGVESTLNFFETYDRSLNVI
jgi:hypothetical protein